ncbi:hypothetical protein QBC34DRAFT_363206 [Podospora aff. communis PSN243]|uniref:Uncharacterized protein n=1 Tax=Podospora aff. communis PSN243 TaxID=3040156 RepID=A0AAV9G6J1_9PEZI|nr:hypothetical protein QBC34DRAFT_363206 [Podospora aff. communis PSN243]
MAAIVKTLREHALAAQSVRVAPDTMVDGEHQAVLVRAIGNVLAAEEAVFTFAQIIDGLPTADVAWDRLTHHLTGDHPLDEHEELCPGAMDKARELCGRWRTEMLAFDPKLLRAFCAATPGSPAFETRLFELVAVAVHQFAALVYQLDLRLHRGDVDAVVQWVDPLPADYTGPVLENTLPPTVFYHSLYTAADVYPEGISDMVGYWAEDRIFGGVVVFDRRAEEADATRPTNVYLHPNRKSVTGHVTQLRDEQQRALVDYLLAENPTTSTCPLPILVDRENRERVAPEVSIIKHSIFRDVWERKPLTTIEMDVAVRRPRRQIDHPEIFDTMLYSNMVLGNQLSEGLMRRVESGESPVYDPAIRERVIQELGKVEAKKEAERETEAPPQMRVAREENETTGSRDDGGRESSPEEGPKKREAHAGQDDRDGPSKADDEERRKRRREG